MSSSSVEWCRATPGLFSADGRQSFWLIASAGCRRHVVHGALAAFGGAPNVSPLGRKPIATTSWSASLWSDGLPLTRLAVDLEHTRPGSPFAGSPSRSGTGRRCSTSSCRDRRSGLSRRRDRVLGRRPTAVREELAERRVVAGLGARERVDVDEAVAVGVDAGAHAGVVRRPLERRRGLLSHSPQMFTPNAACQWSPGVAACRGERLARRRRRHRIGQHDRDDADARR